VIGYFAAEFGLGEFGRKIAAAVEAPGLPMATTIYRHTHSRQGHPFNVRDATDAPFDTNVI
jgi:hypothetical protein